MMRKSAFVRSFRGLRTVPIGAFSRLQVSLRGPGFVSACLAATRGTTHGHQRGVANSPCLNCDPGRELTLGRAPASLSDLYLQRHLVRAGALILDQELELAVLLRRELHLAFRAGTGVLTDLLLVFAVDEQMHVRLLLPIRRDGDRL